jgi:hypothetical protein
LCGLDGLGLLFGRGFGAVLEGEVAALAPFSDYLGLVFSGVAVVGGMGPVGAGDGAAGGNLLCGL